MKYLCRSRLPAGQSFVYREYAISKGSKDTAIEPFPEHSSLGIGRRGAWGAFLGRRRDANRCRTGEQPETQGEG